MKKTLLLIGLLVLAIVAGGLVAYFKPEALGRFPNWTGMSGAAETKMDDFQLLDYQGRWHELYRQAGSRAVVIISTAVGAPDTKEAILKIKALRDKFASQGIVFWMLNSDPQQERTDIAREATELGLDLPVLEDKAQLVANALGVRQTCEAICINATNWMTFYRGAIDRDLADSKSKVRGPKNLLENALASFLAGKRVSPNRTLAKGTAIPLAVVKDDAAKTISYAAEVAPILQKSCVPCHSPGNIGPFAMTSYEKVKGRAEMMREVLLTQRMPPWHADPHYGSFVNQRSLSPEQAQLLVRWVEQGAPRGDGEDILAAKAPPPAQDWPMGPPDYVLKFPKPEQIPASGVFDYRYVVVRSPIRSNAWLRAAVVRPGNKKAVHHILVMLTTAEELQNRKMRGGEGINGYFAAYVPGYQAVPFPEGAGKLLPAGGLLVFQVHYTATGREETDQSEMGLYLSPEKPSLELKTRSAYNAKFEIPPGVANQESEAEFRFTKDALLYDMSPHMHLRGSWFTYEAIYPDGKKEVLLSVPHYDFKWQHLYRLATPKRLPAGTRLVCRGAHDNSPQNPDNPDPSQTVKFGGQTFEEMFIGYFDYTDAPPQPATVARGGGG